MASNPVIQRGDKSVLAGDVAAMKSTRERKAAASEIGGESGAATPPVPASFALPLSPDATLCLGTDGMVYGANARAASLFGYHPKLMAGAHIGAFVSLPSAAAKDAPDLHELLRQLITGDGQAIEAMAHTLSGQNLPVEITSIRHQAEGHEFIICALRDISHRKHNESALAEAKEVAERANVAKLEFLSQLSHELRTPLAAIIGFGEVMRDEMFGPLGVRLYQTYAADICQSGRQLADVVERIIDVTRLEGRMTTAHARTADLAEIVDHVIERAAAEATKQNVRLHSSLRRGSLPVVLDDETLGKMVGHVVANAIAYNRFGGKVEIAATAEPGKDSNLINLSVTDTGPGMLPDRLAELRRAIDGGAGESSGGLGMCAAFLHLIGGGLDICSAPNLGTTVTLTFPRRYDGRWRP